MPRQQVTPATTTAAETRRSWPGWRCRLRLGTLRAPEGSPRSPASRGAHGWARGGMQRHRRRGPRQLKLWWRRNHRNGAREEPRFAPTVSTSARELVGLGGVTKRSPGWRRRPARAAASFGFSRSSDYGDQEAWGGGANDGGAHIGCSSRLSGLVGGRTTSGHLRRSGVLEIEDDAVEGVAVLPSLSTLMK